MDGDYGRLLERACGKWVGVDTRVTLAERAKVPESGSVPRRPGLATWCRSVRPEARRSTLSSVPADSPSIWSALGAGAGIQS